MKTRLPIYTALLMAGLATTTEAGTLAGNVQFVTGEASLLAPDGSSRAVQKGGAVEEGDRVKTSGNSIVQLKMIDGGLLSVRANTDMTISTYQTGNKQNTKGKVEFSLASGTFRSITGAISKANKQGYKVTTPVATIGIRGTDHEPLHIPPAADGSNQQEAGTYDMVNDGQTVLSSEQGSIILSPGQVGYVPDGNTPPSTLPDVPDIYTSPTGISSTPSSSDTTPESTPTLLTTTGDTTVLTSTTQTAVDQVVTSTLLSPGSLAPANWAGVGANTWLDSSGLPISGSGSVTYLENPLVTIGSQNELRYLKVTDTKGTFEFNAASAPLLQTGSLAVTDSSFNPIGANIYWGRWGSGFTLVDSSMTQTPTGDFHYMWTDNLTPASTIANMTGTAYYNPRGHTSPTDQNGLAGSLNSAYINVDFGQQTVQAGLSISMPNNQNWEAVGSGTISQFTSTTSSGVALTQNSTLGNMTILGQTTNSDGSRIQGQFVGTNAEGMIASYNLIGQNGAGAVSTVTGTIALDSTTCGGGGC